MYLFVGKSVNILITVLAYVYASESMLRGCFVFNSGTEYARKLNIGPCSYPLSPTLMTALRERSGQADRQPSIIYGLF